ncbi:type VII secretion protein EccB [Mycobacterium haemophilum]|uniref:Secretion protein EccB n=1 Tax=Mycobacterium haemophilum TaxID=29311 RepID=A0A0I9TGY8_9MYCO|nr:type VII secretion protein EccB [Mycobacterium haemophilum]KLO28911.1 secretion protein EccB [Mycobacterium haemophilum]KLO35656.1 secretion protein EccB [Mycobacterium haemophilum]KLO41099.1 secretion protein EccB [Mycobacterium haemophilum]KLO49080.1 secretion protein EccB [Mycobacterium haemophilum]
MVRHPTTWLHVSGYRFLVRRIECALLRRDISTADGALRTHPASLALGCLVATVVVAGCAFCALMQPSTALGHAQIVMGRESGALYVRVGDTWHPALNLASARLIAATDSNPQPVRESELGRTKRGPLLGIPGAPQLLGSALPGDESVWTICDTDGGRPQDAATTVIVGPVAGSSVHRVPPEQTLLVAAAPGSPAYLLYNQRRAVVDLADPAVLRALRLEGRAPRIVSQSLLNAVPEAPPITAPRIRGAGDHTVAELPGFPVGSVLRIIRADGDEYYVVLGAGVQHIGQVAADLLRFSDSQGAANVVTVAPDVIRATPIVNTLPVSTFPDRAPTPSDAGAITLCVTWAPAQSGGIAFLAGSGLPVPAGQAPVTLSQADGTGPALDAVYVAPGRSAYVRAVRLSGGLSGENARAGTRYLVTDTGVRFAIHDDAAAHDLGLPAAAIPAPWPVLATLPSGPELSRENASVGRDVVATRPP